MSQLETRGGHSPVHGDLDPHDEPSAAWGWHGAFPKATRIAGILSAIVLCVMLYSNEDGHVSTLWVAGIAIAVVVLIGLDWQRKRHSWRR